VGLKLYLECGMGASGDMLMAALYELLPDGEAFTRKMDAAGIAGVSVTFEKAARRGVSGTHARVVVNGREEAPASSTPKRRGARGDGHDHTHPHDPHDHDHPHSHDHDHDHTHPHNHDHTHDHGHEHDDGAGGFTAQSVREILTSLDLPENVREDALAVYALLADAEAAIHGESADTVHFHVGGAMDAVADIVGCCMLVHMLGLRKGDISASPVHVGSGFARCSHGVLPVPTPATARLLTGVPIYGGAVEGELCTPTGAALLRHFAGRFGGMETASVRAIGYGVGSADFERPNCLRAFLLEPYRGSFGDRDEIFEINCNLDDMTPEAIGAASDRLLEGGALDVFTSPIYMKKNRPAVLLTCLCRADDRAAVTDMIFAHTTTIGLRVKACSRDKLEYVTKKARTPYGPVRVKLASGHGVTRAKPEYDDAARAAKEHGVTFTQVCDAALRDIAGRGGTPRAEK
jgi:uncharacterized protein (TIGR00299 family) protein